MADRSLRIKLLADTSSYRSEMERASRLGNNYYKSAQSGSQRLTAYLNQNTTSFAGLNKNIQVATNTLKTFAGAFLGGFAVSGIVNTADSYGQMAQRIKNSLQSVEGDFSNYDTVQKRLLETSIRNAKELADSQELYIRSAESMKSLGYSTEQTLDFVESLSSAFTSNATSSEKVQSSINALNKSFVSGKVGIDQWRTLVEAMPNLTGELAKSMGKTREEVVKLGNGGKLSTAQLASGLIKAKDSFNELADSMDNTVKDGFVQLSNAFQAWIGEANQTHKVTATLVQGMTYLAKNFDIVVNSGTAIIALSLARYFGNLSTSLYTNITATIANTQAQVANAKAELELAQVKRVSTVLTLKDAEAKYAAATGTNAYRAASQALVKAKAAEAASLTAVTAAQQRLNAVSITAGSTIRKLATGGLALIGGPAGAAMLAGGAILYFMNKAKEAKQESLGLGEKIDKLKESFDGLTNSQLELKKLELLEDEKKLADQIGLNNYQVNRAAQEYDNLKSRYNSWYSSWTTSEDSINAKRKEQLQGIEEQNKLLENQKKVKNAIADIDNRLKNGNSSTKKPGNLPKKIDESGGETNTGLENYLKNLNNKIAVTRLELQGATQEAKKLQALQATGFKDDKSAEAQQVIALTAEYEKLNLAKTGKVAAEKEIYDQKSPLDKINIDEQAKLDLLNQWKATGLANEQTYQDALNAVTEEASKKRKKIDDDEAAARLASNQLLLSSSADIFDSLAGIAKAYEGEASSTYKALFAASKGFAIANATLNLSTAIMQAMADPTALTPAQKFANYASVAAAGGTLVSQISSVALTGMAHDGIDYVPKEGTWLLQKGERVLNAEQNKDFSEAVSGKSSSPSIVINNNSSAEVIASYDDKNEIINIAVNKAKAEVASSVRNKQGEVWNALKTTTNVTSRL